tara:strand:+ start:181183 stop:181506 length:324 start_codon:yes stop_codon:yes gene_type:complete
MDKLNIPNPVHEINKANASIALKNEAVIHSVAKDLTKTIQKAVSNRAFKAEHQFWGIFPLSYLNKSPYWQNTFLPALKEQGICFKAELLCATPKGQLRDDVNITLSW